MIEFVPAQYRLWLDMKASMNAIFEAEEDNVRRGNQIAWRHEVEKKLDDALKAVLSLK